MVEGRPPEVCRKYAEERLGRGGSGEHGRFTFGQYSDDTQLARELMQSYVERGRFDPEDYARRIAGISSEGRIVGGGTSTQEAAERLASGIAWDEAGPPPPSAGNGSAMRGGPLGLLSDLSGNLRLTAIERHRPNLSGFLMTLTVVDRHADVVQWWWA